MTPNKSLKVLGLGVASSASTASGAIVVFDINPDVVHNPSTPTFYDVGALDFSSGTFATDTSSSFRLNGTYYALNFFEGSVRTVLDPGLGNYLSVLSSGDAIGSSSNFSKVYYSSYAYHRLSEMPLGTYYIALQYDSGAGYHYGWLEFTSEPYPPDKRALTFTRFAFNDIIGQSILASQTYAVPEASTLGFAGGLFGLVAAAHLRRRRNRQAAASEKFLALAAGEKLG